MNSNPINLSAPIAFAMAIDEQEKQPNGEASQLPKFPLVLDGPLNTKILCSITIPEDKKNDFDINPLKIVDNNNYEHFKNETSHSIYFLPRFHFDYNKEKISSDYLIKNKGQWEALIKVEPFRKILDDNKVYCDIKKVGKHKVKLWIIQMILNDRNTSSGSNVPKTLLQTNDISRIILFFSMQIYFQDQIWETNLVEMGARKYSSTIAKGELPVILRPRKRKFHEMRGKKMRGKNGNENPLKIPGESTFSVNVFANQSLKKGTDPLTPCLDNPKDPLWVFMKKNALLGRENISYRALVEQNVTFEQIFKYPRDICDYLAPKIPDLQLKFIKIALMESMMISKVEPQQIMASDSEEGNHSIKLYFKTSFPQDFNFKVTFGKRNPETGQYVTRETKLFIENESSQEQIRLCAIPKFSEIGEAQCERLQNGNKIMFKAEIDSELLDKEFISTIEGIDKTQAFLIYTQPSSHVKSEPIVLD